MEKFVTKSDLGDFVLGLDEYQPLQEENRRKYLAATSGTSTGTPTLVMMDIPNVTKDDLSRAWNQDARAIARVSSHNYFTLFHCIELLFDSSLERFLCIDAKQLKHPHLSQLLNEYEPREIQGIPSMIEYILRTVSQQTRDVFQRTVTSIGTIGEILNKRIFTLIKKTLPTAKITSQYGLTEIVYFSFNELTDFSKNNEYIVRDPHSCQVSILNPDTNGYGEIVITSTPLGAYRTGDFGKVNIKNGQTIITLQGRANFDIVHCLGATFIASEIETLFNGIQDFVSDYDVEVSERAHEPVGEIRIQVVPTTQLLQQKDPNKFISQYFAQHLYVTKTRVLSELIAQGTFSEPIVTLGEIQHSGKKKYRLHKKMS